MPSGPVATHPAAFDAPCVDGEAAGFPCAGVDLLAYLPLEEVGGSAARANDVWGWTDPESGRDFVLLGRGDGTAFVEVTSPTAPRYLGLLPTASFRSPWRDVKVLDHYALVVSEAPEHGLQVFDLRTLLEAPAVPSSFTASAVYRGEGLGSAHNLAVDEATGFAYVVGSTTCDGGLHMVDLASPTEPRFSGCFSEDGYTHDAQCVLYRGPDPDYRGREICFAANEDTLTVVDVTDKSTPRQIARVTYPGVAYTHQVWTTEDHLFLLLDDELDEETFGHGTKTRIWDLADLDRPRLVGEHVAPTPAIDHNLYVDRGLVFQANYRAGLRIYRLDAVAEGRLEPAGFFDVYPDDDEPAFNGAWSVYPFFASGVVAVSGIEQGLFLLELEAP